MKERRGEEEGMDTAREELEAKEGRCRKEVEDAVEKGWWKVAPDVRV